MSTARYTRQKYKDVEIEEVSPLRYPITQLKFDGIWCLAEVYEGGYCRYFSRTGECKHEQQLNEKVPAGCYIGELMFGSEWAQEPGRKGKFFIFDIVELESVDLRREPYQHRMEIVNGLFREKRLWHKWQPIVNYPTSQVQDIWRSLVETQKFEGLVFRHPDEVWEVTVPRAKLELEVDLKIVGMERGEGKFRNTLGTLLCVTETGIPVSVGGGLSNELRDQLWYKGEACNGLWFVATCKKVFNSGKLRHPNFNRWHADKK